MEVQLTILNEEGMHARPAGIFVKTANQYKSKIEMLFGGKAINAKSVLSIMSLGLSANSVVTLKAEGPDAENALTVLTELVKNKFQLGS